MRFPSPTQMPSHFMDLPPALLSECIARNEGGRGDFSIPLLRASLAGEFRIVGVLPGGRVPPRAMEPTRPPTLVIVSGDPNFPEPTPPPSAFPKVQKAIRWAATIIVHATGGRREDYATVAAAVPILRQVLLIETGTSQEDAWLRLVSAEVDRRARSGAKLPVLVFSARPRGGFHPIGGDY
ncbi:hypothetical protein [Muricoccus pecuniae]|uniref:Uncharacterized protein n=1 Tax=Muricoccus pecuniae TaxID=693023 RepID=A0A840Y9Y3_9PROT|nr:hypothetical protein [Roseomonas pecuniae]MBB5695519.1 hypothetical protein [Roseomonas pecuniae]